MKIIKLRELSRVSFIRMAVAYVLLLWLLPLLTIAFRDAVSVSLDNYYLLLALPIAMLILSFAIATKYGFCPILMAVIAIVLAPPFAVYGYQPFWQYCLFYAAIYGAGNYVTSEGRKKKGD